MLTKEQVIKKYSNIPLYFSSYYKYLFTFIGMAGMGIKIVTYSGGDHDSIYRYSVEAGKPYYLVNKTYNSNDFQWDYVCISENGDKIFELDARY